MRSYLDEHFLRILEEANHLLFFRLVSVTVSNLVAGLEAIDVVTQAYFER